jgi:hypothetical protein
MGTWYILFARPEDRTLLESNLSAGVGELAERQGQIILAFLFRSPPLQEALNSGGAGGQRPREILHRRLVAQAAVRPLLVVVAAPKLI